MSHKNRNKLRKGNVARLSDMQSGKKGGDSGPRLLPNLASPPTEGSIDPDRMTRELAKLTEIWKRA